GCRGATVWLRLFFIALYFHSGLSKLDVSFLREMGPVFLDTALRTLDAGRARLSERARTCLVLAMPMSEVAIALALSFPRTRRAGVVGAVLLHAVLVVLLGPMGLRHSTIVLVWNMAMLMEVVALFWRRGPVVVTRNLPNVFAGVVFVLAALLPFGERLGWFD